MTGSSVTVRHNFETAHRLPALGGKCTNLHGHSWWAEVTFTGPKDRNGVVAEFAALKRGLRDWIDANLDHGAMLGVGDPLVDALIAAQSKVFRFGAAKATNTERYASGLFWPTVENVAELLARVAVDVIAGYDLTVSHVRVTETSVNAAEWSA